MVSKIKKEARDQSRINKKYNEIIALDSSGEGNPWYYGGGSGTSRLEQDARESEREIDRKVSILAKIKKAEEHGIFTPQQAMNEKRKHGLLPTDGSSSIALTEQPQQSASYRLLIQEIAQEEDDDTRIQMIQSLSNIEVAMKQTGNAQINIPTITRRKKGEDKSTKDVVFEKMIEAMMLRFNEKPQEYDKVKDFGSMLEMMKNYNDMLSPSEGSDDILENIKKYKEAGFIQDKSITIEEKRLELEKEKVNLEYDFKKTQLENEGKRTEQITKIVTDVATSLLEAVVDVRGKKGQNEPRTQDSSFARDNLNKAASAVEMFQAPCVGCKGVIEVTNVNQARNISCPSCGQQYYLDSKNKQLMTIEEQKPEPPPDTAESNGLTKTETPKEIPRTNPLDPK